MRVGEHMLPACQFGIRVEFFFNFVKRTLSAKSPKARKMRALPQSRKRKMPDIDLEIAIRH